jgi:hypothetical protein
MRLPALLLCLLFAASLPSCDDDECDGGNCVCEEGESCTLSCPAPPCHAVCAGDNPSCNAVCANGECGCGTGSHCNFACQSPPCHVNCAPGTTCSGVCANGDCECGVGSSCSFTCASGPCHVLCAGGNPSCNGQCSDGTCRCEAGGSCRFVCLDANCHVECAPGATCLLDCPDGNASTGCDFSECAAGQTTCSGGLVASCGAPCP